MASTQPGYVPGHAGDIRVKLTRELPIGKFERFPHFIGELDGTPIRYYCLNVAYVVAIRRGLAERGAVLHDASSSWLDFPEATELAAPLDPELTRLREAVLAGRAGGATDGTPRKRTRKAATA